MRRNKEIDISQFSLFDDNSRIKERVKEHESQKQIIKVISETPKVEQPAKPRAKTIQEFRKVLRESIGRSHPQDITFDIPELRDRKEAWSKEFYTKKQNQ